MLKAEGGVQRNICSSMPSSVSSHTTSITVILAYVWAIAQAKRGSDRGPVNSTRRLTTDGPVSSSPCSREIAAVISRFPVPFPLCTPFGKPTLTDSVVVRCRVSSSFGWRRISLWTISGGVTGLLRQSILSSCGGHSISLSRGGSCLPYRGHALCCQLVLLRVLIGKMLIGPDPLVFRVMLNADQEQFVCCCTDMAFLNMHISHATPHPLSPRTL